METVSQHSKYSISLNRDLNCEFVCQFVVKVINDYLKHDPNVGDCLLVMEIKRPLENIPKLETHN